MVDINNFLERVQVDCMSDPRMAMDKMNKFYSRGSWSWLDISPKLNKVMRLSPPWPSVVYSFKSGGEKWPMASYYIDKDAICLPNPPMDYLGRAIDYHHGYLHELGHWTGSVTRLGRKTLGAFYLSEAYNREELIAELTAVLLSSELEIEIDIDRSSYYLAYFTQRVEQGALSEALDPAMKARDYVLRELDKLSSGCLIKPISVRSINSEFEYLNFRSFNKTKET